VRIVPTKSNADKIVAALDIAITLFIEHIGYTYQLPFYHPVILVTVVILTYALFKWKYEITRALLGLLGPIQNKNRYSYSKVKILRN